MTTNQLNIMNSFLQSYNKVFEVLNSFSEKSNYFNQIRIPKLSDIEVIAMSLTAEYLSTDSECQLFRMLPMELFNKIERSVYNKRKRRLFDITNQLRESMANELLQFEDNFIVDSMPLEVCKLSRSNRSKICKDSYLSSPDKGYCAAQKMHFYGYKFHAVCGVNGVFKSFDISKASVHDIHFLKDLKNSFSNCVIIGDKGYLSAEYQLDLFNTQKIKLETPMRNNQINYTKQAYVFRKVRKRIETLFSQTCDQFMIRRNYAKTFEGFKTRILNKITALTTIQFINKLIGRKMNSLKVSIS